MQSSSPLRLAVWSGPRNVSTALMRSFGNRSDTVVCDEPLYAHYLQSTGLPHPMAEEIIARHETDWEAVVQWLAGPLPEGKTVFYQKHMAHHLLEHVSRDWMADVHNVFLIRDPRQMLTSLLEVIPDSGLADTGLVQQVELFDAECRRTGEAPPVVDSKDLLTDPRAVLGSLCERLGLPFEETMLNWPPGLRSADGCWAQAWYGRALESTGFAPYRWKEARVPPQLHDLEAQCVELYDHLHPHRIQA